MRPGRTRCLVALAYAVLELPAAAAVARDAPQLERADLGDVRFEAHRHVLAGLAIVGDLDLLLDGIELGEALGVGIDQRTGRIVLARRRGEEPELADLADHDRE